jgi:hypothetical protein
VTLLAEFAASPGNSALLQLAVPIRENFSLKDADVTISISQRELFRKILVKAGPKARQARMAHFVEIMKPKPFQRVIDLGGTTKLWRFVDVPLDVTILNLPGQSIDRKQYGEHRFTLITGDATKAPEIEDNSFDIVFSNSVIEHVGPPEKQAAFAAEVRRIAPAYFVQTPSIHFPLEAHTGLPLWWYFPKVLRRRIIEHWRRTAPHFAEFIEDTRVLKRSDLQRFFPDGTIEPEKVLGVTKSYMIWRK